jgi:hypothetical protein
MEQTAKLGSKVLIRSRNPLAFVCILPDEGLGWAEAWLVDVVGIAPTLIQHPATERIFPATNSSVFVFRRLGLRRAPGWRARI